ncbi:hypothetical protein J7438_15225 [Thalassotalea sp. G20_0]|uniref:hypothetical protein n=1 Tax=Thalassotalea sp. G20_0 TaxID=2821093 RepID=UPI001ADA50F8|nr:hypothetical protein [Thalassotalea sp. G20_0]MBO9495429.1 hypothetical protein [Thalassotalea sp. G20_0]
MMDHITPGELTPRTVHENEASRSNNSNRPNTDGSRYRLYDVRSIGSSNNYLLSDQGAVGGADFPERSYPGAAGFQSHQHQPVRTYEVTIHGYTHAFTSLRELLQVQSFMDNFRGSAEVYLPGIDIPHEDAELRKLIHANECIQQVFLMANEIETLNVSASSDQTQLIEQASGNDYHLPAPSGSRQRTVSIDNHQINDIETVPSDVEPVAIYNQRMACETERMYSFTKHFASRCVAFLDEFPRGNRHAIRLSAAGFYLSLNEKKLFCFSCGGSIGEWQDEWGVSTIDEVHARLYPKCSFLQEHKGEHFIQTCQQKLRPEQQQRLVQPLESHPHLYSLPVSDYQWQQEEAARSESEAVFNLHNGSTLVDGMTVPEILRQNRVYTQLAQQNRGWRSQYQPGVTSAIEGNIQRCLQEFHSSFLVDSELHHAIDRLHEKVNDARDRNNQLKLSLLQILEHLMTLPEDQQADTGAEITEMINAADDHDCQDHTSEIIDQIKTRMAFINIRRELEAEHDVVQVSNLLKKLKLFFNESVLYKAMSTTSKSDGTLLVVARESTEIRGRIKNQFSRSICQFPENHVFQRFGDVGRLPPEVMDELESKFKSGIRNKADFQNYIIDMFKTEPQLLDLLRKGNPEFSVWHGKTESNTELLLEQYSPDTPGLSEQEIIEGAAGVADSRRRFMNEDLEQFISEKLDYFWTEILQQTSR